MAGPVQQVRSTGMVGSDVEALVKSGGIISDAVDDIEVLRAGLDTLADAYALVLAKLDADAGVTDTDYASLHDVTKTTYDTAGDMTASKLGLNV